MQPPPPQRFRLTFGRGALICVLVGVLAWIAVSLVVRPLVLSPDIVGTVALERGAAGDGEAGEPGAAGVSDGSPARDAASPDPTDASDPSVATEGGGLDEGSAPGVGDEPSIVIVHVAGAVEKPGVYELPAGARVHDAVDRAGGTTADAQTSAVNLAAAAVDGQQILIPTEDQVAAGGAAPSPAGPAGDGVRVPVNTADAAGLEELPGIGPALAARIIEFRESNGPFQDLADLDAVSGIGPAMMEELDGLVSF